MGSKSLFTFSSGYPLLLRHKSWHIASAGYTLYPAAIGQLNFYSVRYPWQLTYICTTCKNIDTDFVKLRHIIKVNKGMPYKGVTPHFAGQATTMMTIAGLAW